MRVATRVATKLWAPAALALLAGCADERAAQQQAPEKTPAATPPATDVDAIKEQPSRFFGKTVRVTGEIDQMHNERAFQLDGTGWAFDDNITVLTRTPVRVGGLALAPGDEVIVEGTVRPFVVADVEKDLGWDIGSDVEVRLSKRPVLVASSVRRVVDYGQWTAAGAPAATEPVTTTLVIFATVEPATLSGRKVDLGRERVQAVTGKGLWVGPNPMSQVFVLPSGEVKGVQPGDWVSVKGTLQTAPKDAAKAWNLPENMAGAAGEGTLFVDNATVSEVEVKAAPGGPGQGIR